MEKTSWNPEFRSNLEKQYLTIRDQPMLVVHSWLCHPGKLCDDGCNARPILARSEAMEKVENYFYQLENQE